MTKALCGLSHSVYFYEICQCVRTDAFTSLHEVFMYAVGLLVFVGAKIFIELSNRLNSLCIGTIPQNIVPNIKPNKD